MTPLQEAIIYLIQVIFNLYLSCFLLRFILQCVRADFNNPLGQFVIRITNPLLRPLRRFIPSLGGYDTSAIVLILGIDLVKLSLLAILELGQGIAPVGMVCWLLGDVIIQCSNLYFFTLLGQIILSWVNPWAGNPLASILWQVNEPLLRPIQRILPPIGGLDLSPMALLVALKLVEILVANPLISMGLRT